MTSRLGSWQPEGAEQRLDRLESIEEIRQLVARYALAIDTRDLEALAGLFSPSVRIGSSSAILRRSMVYFSAASASEISAAVTEPNS